MNLVDGVYQYRHLEWIENWLMVVINFFYQLICGHKKNVQNQWKTKGITTVG